MSKFYGNSSDGASSSDSEVETRQQVKKSAFSRIAAFSSDESSSNESVARDKPMKKDVFVDMLRSVRSHIRNNDYAGLGSDYTNVVKAVEKRSSSDELPKAFIRVLYELQTFITELQASGATKKMSQIKAQAVNKLKAQMKKGNKAYEEELEKCKENPSEFDVLNETNEDSGSESDDESEESWGSESRDSDSDSSASDSGESMTSSSRSSSSSSSDSSDLSSGSSNESSDWNMSEESSDEEEDEMARRERRMRRWLKDSDESDYETVKPKAVTAVRRKKQEPRKVVAQPDGDLSGDESVEAKTGVAVGPIPAELPEKEFLEKVKELLSTKKTGGVTAESLNADLAKLDEFVAASAQWGPICQLSLTVATISYVMDSRVGGILPDAMWSSALVRVKSLIDLLKVNPSAYSVSLHELVPEISVESDVDAAKRRRVNGIAMVSAITELIDDEFNKSFQNLESSEYAEKLGLLPDLVSLLLVVRVHLVGESGCAYLAARVSTRILWHMHYQSTRSLDLLSKRVPELSTVTPESLTDSIFAYGSKKDKAGAILLSAFIAASAGDVVQAKRLISSDLFDLVAVSEVSLQIQYNRALAMVGIAALAAGDVKDSYNLLTDICTSGRLKELLAQGINRQQVVEKTAEADRAERRRLLPYHLHLNIELIEAAYNLASLVLEVPHLSKSLLSSDTNAFSRRMAKYRRQLESYDRQVFAGPPEFAKDAIALAGKAILNDDVGRAVSLIDNLKIWDNLAVGAKDKVIKLVRIAGLLTYLTNNSSSHKNFSLDELGMAFSLTRQEILSTICRFIMVGDIAGKISGDFFVPAAAAVGKMQVFTQSLSEQTRKLETVTVRTPSESTGLISDDMSDETKEVISAILAQLTPAPTPAGVPEREVGARRVRKAGLASAKVLAASQQAAERRLQAGLAKRRGWDNARGQPLQGQVISTERKKLFGKSYGY